MPSVYDRVLSLLIASPLFLAALAILLALNLGLIVLLVALLLACAALLVRLKSFEEGYLLVLVGLGAFLGLMCEFFAIKGDVGRMNTVFKFYLQVWMLWSIAGAIGFWRAFQALKVARPRWLFGAWTAVLVGLVLACSVYPVVGTLARVADRFDTSVGPTLDGTAYMQKAVYFDEGRELVLRRDLEAIKWIQENIEGSPVLLEGRSPLYRWGSRISVYTGLPTVLGWDWHQKQQRAGYSWMIDERAADVEEMYSGLSPERTLSLLRKYDVAYIYVGDLERAYYPAAGLEKFDEMVGDTLDLVYNRDGVKIYKVR